MKLFLKLEKCFYVLAILVIYENQAQQYGSEIPANENLGPCECYNPWLNESFLEHQGDPGKTCPTFCYVHCSGGCVDSKPAQSGGRCWSEEACKYGLLDGQCVQDRAFR
eukprot:TRINITY_DN15490_c0_g1_i1.p2 TRINITY_DN15490_c0_g1~~TRINITY_DN15490_c0_g1_i1.p2  ORF type:complete len:109 (-),score=19.79 TRINITY_DN15490_c0_g1_i1:428-754(-)